MTAHALLERTGPIVIVATAILLIYSDYAPHALHFSVGAIVSTLTAKLLKRFLKQPRPSSINGHHDPHRDYGMPSSHSTAIAFMASYAILWTLYDSRTSVGITLALLLFVSGGFGLVAGSRVGLGHHTLEQVVVGSVVGATVALLWYYGVFWVVKDAWVLNSVRESPSLRQCVSVGIGVAVLAVVARKEREFRRIKKRE
ncbi:PAP2 superfamily-domain-containing protein [Chytriomyces cf. hyalinus JEL632]|nr:PAP2 superfamily-domain-containing protein [Chytriomyces cf. hyalinus JEL632]